MESDSKFAKQQKLEYTLNDDKGIKQIIIRSKLGVYFADSYSNTLQDKTNYKFFQQANYLQQTANGQIVIVSSQKRMIAFNLKTNTKLFDGEYTFVYYIALSPCQKYVQLFDKKDINQGVTYVYTLIDFKQVYAFEQGMNTNFVVRESYPLLKFTNDDKLVFKYRSKTIQIFNNEFKLVGVIEIGLIDFFSLSQVSNQNNYLLAAFYLDKKTNQGKIYLYNNNSLEKPFYIKNIDKAEEIKVKFNPNSHDFLIQLQTYFDHTGKSYYGQYGLYFFNYNQKKLHRVKTYQGPIHDFSWDPLGQKFIVISGFMPACSVLFNKKNQPIFEFGKHHKNTITWNLQGRFVCLSGYGNLNGQMQVWDVDQLRKIGQCKSSSASYCQWSPDGRKLLTAIVTPRLRVDNCYKIFSYTGVLLKTFDLKHTQLYQVQWRRSLLFKQRKGVSPNRKIPDFIKKNEQKKFFRPKGSSITADLLNADKGKYQARILTKNQTFDAPKPTNLVPGQHAEQPKKKKKKKKKQKQTEQDYI